MKNSHPILWIVALIFLTLQACQAPNPQPIEGNPTTTTQQKRTESYHYHDGHSATAREIIIDRQPDGSVIIHRHDILLNAASQLANLVTLDSDPIPAGSDAAAVYNPGSTAWFIPFGQGNAERLRSTGDEVDVSCDCTTHSDPNDWGVCLLDWGGTRKYWSCLNGGGCDDGCAVTIVFSSIAHAQPGITLKANYVFIQ